MKNIESNRSNGYKCFFPFTCFIPVAAATFQFSAAAIFQYDEIHVRELEVSCRHESADFSCDNTYVNISI